MTAWQTLLLIVVGGWAAIILWMGVTFAVLWDRNLGSARSAYWAWLKEETPLAILFRS